MSNQHAQHRSDRRGARSASHPPITAGPTLSVNPYGLPLAPVRPERPSAPCDLADYGAGEEFRGWQVIFSRDVDFGLFRRAREVFQAAKEAQEEAEAEQAEQAEQEEGAEQEEQGSTMSAPATAADRMAAAAAARGMNSIDVMDDVMAWLEEILLGWNFVDARGRPLPQPRDGGVQYCPVAALPAIAKAFGKSTQPPKK